MLTNTRPLASTAELAPPSFRRVEGLADLPGQIGVGEGLAQQVYREVPVGVATTQVGGGTGDEQEPQVGMGRAHPAEELEAVHLRHVDVGDHQGGGGRSVRDGRQGFDRSRSRMIFLKLATSKGFSSLRLSTRLR